MAKIQKLRFQLKKTTASTEWLGDFKENQLSIKITAKLKRRKVENGRKKNQNKTT